MKIAGEKDGEYFFLDTPLSVMIEQEINVPCDSLKAVFAYSDNFPYFNRIYILNDNIYNIKSAVECGDVIFSGITDETVLKCDSKKSEITVYARSLAALLTDNESDVLVYNDPSIDVIIREHAEPFGITKRESFVSKERKGTFSVKRGSSHYKVLHRFCREFLSSVMRIDHTGKIIADIYSQTFSVLFDNRKGVPFNDLSVSDNRYNIISEIKVYDKNGYCLSVKNPECEGTEIKRVRSLNLMESSVDSVSDVQRIIKASGNKSFTVQLDCPISMLNTLGRPALVNAPLCKNRVLYIEKINYTFDKNSEHTVVKMTARGDS